MNWERILNFYNIFAVSSHPSWSHLGLQNERLHHAFDAMAALIDLPDDGRLLGVTKEVVVMLIQAAETESSRRFACWEELDEIYESASDQAPSGKSKDPLWGIYGKHPVFAFLMYYHLHFPPGSVMKDKFRHLAPFLVRRMWKCFTQMEEPSADYLYRLGLASQEIVAAGSPFS
ncbi:hypothetical protein, partial [Alcanivorax sp.]|uniref:hypothetical protein n=1 Tax=Alcanivorax sp. TaxID=1872427 RepID=UPI002582C74E